MVSPFDPTDLGASQVFRGVSSPQLFALNAAILHTLKKMAIGPEQGPAIGPVIAFILYPGPDERPASINEPSRRRHIGFCRRPIAVKHQLEHAGKPIDGSDKLCRVRLANTDISAPSLRGLVRNAAQETCVPHSEVCQFACRHPGGRGNRRVDTRHGRLTMSRDFAQQKSTRTCENPRLETKRHTLRDLRNAPRGAQARRGEHRRSAAPGRSQSQERICDTDRLKA